MDFVNFFIPAETSEEPEKSPSLRKEKKVDMLWDGRNMCLLKRVSWK